VQLLPVPESWFTGGERLLASHDRELASKPRDGEEGEQFRPVLRTKYHMESAQNDLPKTGMPATFPPFFA